MTIEIRQLVIRAVADASQNPGKGRGGDDDEEGSTLADPGPELRGEALIAACVREVMRELRRSRER